MEVEKSKTVDDLAMVQAALLNADDFALIINAYQQKLLRYIRRTLFVNSEDAEDILQEVFIKVYKNLNDYNSKHKFSSWIYRITYNACIDYIRKNSKHNNNIDIDQEMNFVSNLVADCDLDSNIITEQTTEAVNGLLNQLDEKYRMALSLKYVEELDYEEISEIMHLPSGTVGSLINRGKQKLKQLLTKNGYTIN